MSGPRTGGGYVEKQLHLKMKIAGGTRKIALFHAMMKDMDGDWPFDIACSTPPPVCSMCGGVVYRRPRFDIQDIKALSRQLNDFKGVDGHLNVKIQGVKGTEACLEAWRKQAEEATLRGEVDQFFAASGSGSATVHPTDALEPEGWE